MRQRRIQRLIARIDDASHSRGCVENGRAALEELERLDPDLPQLPALRQQLERLASDVPGFAAPAADPPLAPPPKISGPAEPQVPVPSPLPVVLLQPPDRSALVEPDVVVSPTRVAPPSSTDLAVSEPDVPQIRSGDVLFTSAVLEHEEEPARRRTWPWAVAAIVTIGIVAWFAVPELQRPTTRLTQSPPAAVAPARPVEPTPEPALPPVQIAIDEVPATDAGPEPPATLGQLAEPAGASHAGIDSRVADKAVAPESKVAAATRPELPVSTSTGSVLPPLPPGPPPGVPVPLSASSDLPVVPPAPRSEPPAVAAPVVGPSPAAPVATSGELSAPTPTRSADAGDAIRGTLQQYESAYSRLDADAAGAVWPGLDRRALARAFEGLASQRVELGDCDVRMTTADAAVADCAGSATWTPKVGGGSRTQPRRWHFRLSNVSGRWQIVGVIVK